MNSILGNTFLAIQDRLQAVVPALKWIDQELGQLEYGERPQVLWPCALIDLPDTNYSDEGENSQIAEPVLVVRLGVATYNQSAQVVPISHREKALEYYNLEHAVNKALHGWCDSRYFAPLSRVNARTEQREDNIRVRVLRYRFAFRDSTAVELPGYTVPLPGMELV